MRKTRDRLHLRAAGAREDGALPDDPAALADVMGWEPSKGSHPLPRWCAAGKPAGSPRAWQQWTDQSDGRTLPSFVTGELHDFLGCGILARGLAQLFCPSCHERYVVGYSCKGRGFCPSCGGRRMNAGALTLLDYVLPEVPIRQFVLTVPFPLRFPLAFGTR